MLIPIHLKIRVERKKMSERERGDGEKNEIWLVNKHDIKSLT